MVVMITVFFTVINVVFIFIEWFVFNPILEYVALFYGVFIGWHAVSRTISAECLLHASGLTKRLFLCCSLLLLLKCK